MEIMQQQENMLMFIFEMQNQISSYQDRNQVLS